MFSAKVLRACYTNRLRHACLQLSARETSIAPECLNDHQKNGNEEGPSRVKHQVNEETEEKLHETKKRIRRWKARNAPSAEANEGSNVQALRRITEAEFVEKVGEEEREWSERAEDLISSLSTVSLDGKRATTPSPANWRDLTPEELELKRKTGKAQFRKILYNEGELDASNLTEPPSTANPHPFEPSKHAPPVYSRSIVPFVNYSPLLQALVDIGVNLFEVEQTTRAAKHLLRLDMQNEVKPKLQWLVSLGFNVNDLGEYLTRNPFFLLQELNDMKARVNYLTAMKFTNEDICKIVKDFRYWLNVDVKTMDSRLGWIQQQFSLTGDEVRGLIRKEARIVMFGLGPLQRLVLLFNKELEFTSKEMRRILLTDPRVYMMDAKFVATNYAYIHRVMRLSNAIIAKNPLILRCSHSSIRNRHEFLKKLGKAVYEGAIASEKDENTPKSCQEEVEAIPLQVFLDPSDEAFARKAANTYLAVYNNFLRNN